MTIFRLTDSRNDPPPPGYRKWDAAERERLDALLAEVDAATAQRKPGASASAKADNYGWDAIVARVIDPARLRLVAKDGRS